MFENEELKTIGREYLNKIKSEYGQEARLIRRTIKELVEKYNKMECIRCDQKSNS